MVVPWYAILILVDSYKTIRNWFSILFYHFLPNVFNMV